VCARREDSVFFFFFFFYKGGARGGDAPHCRRAHGWCSSRTTCSGRTPPTVTRGRCAYSARTCGNPDPRECSSCLPPEPHADEWRQLEPRLRANDFVRGVDSCATRVERSSSDAARRTCSKSGPSMHGRAQRRRARRRRARTSGARQSSLHATRPSRPARSAEAARRRAPAGHPATSSSDSMARGEQSVGSASLRACVHPRERRTNGRASLPRALEWVHRKRIVAEERRTQERTRRSTSKWKSGPLLPRALVTIRS
jgi:hypothetical protein